MKKLEKLLEYVLTVSSTDKTKLFELYDFDYSCINY